MYLGANVRCVLDGDSNKMWFLSAADYIDGALKRVAADLPMFFNPCEFDVDKSVSRNVCT
jgi:hypothetical protein